MNEISSGKCEGTMNLQPVNGRLDGLDVTSMRFCLRPLNCKDSFRFSIARSRVGKLAWFLLKFLLLAEKKPAKKGRPSRMLLSCETMLYFFTPVNLMIVNL